MTIADVSSALSGEFTRERAEAAIRERDERLRLAHEAAGLIVWEMDIERGHVACSPNAEEVWGIVAGEVERFEERMHPDDRERVRAEAAAAVRDERETFSIEYRVTNPAGETRWLHSRGAVVRERGRAVRFIGVSLDSTERRRAEQLARDSDARTRRVVEAMQQVAWMSDAAGNVQFFNRHWWEYTGSTEASLGTGWTSLLPPEDVASMLDVRARGLAAGEPYQAEIRVRRRDGAYRWHLVRVVPVRDGSGAIECWIGTATDVQYLKEAAAAVVRSEERFKALVLAGAQCVWQWREGDMKPDPGVTRWWREFTGRADALSQRGAWLEDVHPEDKEHAQRAWAASLAEGGEYVVEYRVRRRDGAWRWLEVRGVPVPGASDAAREWAGTIADVTERREAQDALRRSEALFREFMANSPAAAWIVDGAGRLTYLSPTFIRNYAGGRDLTGTLVRDIFPPEIAAEYLENNRLVIESGRPLETIERGLRADGTLGRFIVTKFPIRHRDGETVVGGVAVDITDRALAEQTLQEREALLRAVVDGTPECVKVVNPDGTVRLMNRSGAAIIGSRPDEVVGTCVFEFIAPEHRDEWKRNHERVCAGAHLTWTFEVAPPGGERRWMETHAAPFVLPDGTTAHLAVTRDVTDHRRAEEALRASEERYRLIAQATNDAVWDIDLGARVIHWGDAMASVFGWSDALPSTPLTWWHDRVHPEDLSRVRAAVAELMADPGKTHLQVEYRFLRADGSWADVLDRGHLVRNARGEPVRMIGAMQDLADRKLAERALRDETQRLERAVRERTQALEESHARLRSSERLASLGTLSAGIGHDMGNLLMPARVRLDALRELVGSGAGREDLDAIASCIEDLQRSARGLRLLALDAEQPTGSPRVSDLEGWWRDAFPVVRNAVPKFVRVEHDFEPDLPSLSIAQHQLTQAVFNLVQNAGDAVGPRADGVVRVTARRGPDGRIAVAVEDNGTGMTPEVRARCLEPFFTTKARGISTGLGLALVHGIVQNCGGRLDIESAPGAGSTFTMRLPADRPPASSRAGLTVRLSLDDARVRSFAESIFRAAGFAVAAGDDAGASAWIAQANSGAIDGMSTFVASPDRLAILIGEVPDAGAGRVGEGQVRIIAGAVSPAAVRLALKDVTLWAESRKPVPDATFHPHPLR